MTCDMPFTSAAIPDTVLYVIMKLHVSSYDEITCQLASAVRALSTVVLTRGYGEEFYPDSLY